ncbi:MAG: glycoside hydrolase family 43 protein [Verrucomicrobiae bacterium]|nr:glycoside hydrolase family 43 protein [Verrucomicrobiae bacterium]
MKQRMKAWLAWGGLLLGVGLWGVSGAEAGGRTYRNPIIDRMGPADPHVIRHGGKYYLYPTTDSRGYEVYISTNLVDWELHPRKVYEDVRGGVWAPDVWHDAKGEGKFYLYYTVGRGTKYIGVAVAEGPLGPFVDKGLLATNAIDAHLFQDEDGRLYLYYVNLAGGFKIMVTRMKDALTREGEAVEVIRPTADWEKASGEVTEGPFVLKRQGIYYLMYSGSGADSPHYAIGYATARAPMGPFVKYGGNPIAKRGGNVLGPGHHCVIGGPDGRLWMVYHQKASTNMGWDRFLAIDPLWFDEQGVIHVKTSRGTAEPAP